ncbi:MAG: arginine--tRNA ligase [Candidatus Eiseniibacteriota bacterium]
MLTTDLREALERALAANGWSLPEGNGTSAVPLEVPRVAEHGDYATNLALLIAKRAGLPPRQIAERLAEHVRQGSPAIESAEVAGPGFLNLRLRLDALREELVSLVEAGSAYGTWPSRGTAPVLVEYVSANPTGPMNVVNARAAAVGAVLVRLFRAAGIGASGEFYVNDAGRQVDLLGESVAARFRERIGLPAAFPEEGYQGDYIRDLAGLVPEAEGRAALAPGGDPRYFRTFALERMLAQQKADLEAYGVTFDLWTLESSLHESGALTATLEDLTRAGHVYVEDGATWFRSTTFGDEKDRVLVRQNGEPSYFLADIAYHRDKKERGFGRALDLWGPDHHGHIGRMQASIRALGLPEDFLEIEIVQFVRLLSKGELVKMSKRAGEFITLTDLIGEVGADCAKYFFLMRSTTAHLDFDLDLAKEQSNDNPAYYVQYAHARIASLLRVAAEKGLEPPPDPSGRRTAAQRLVEPEERALLLLLAHFPELVRGAADAREPHRLPTWLAQVAAAFHQFYQRHRVVTDDLELSRGRLLLARGVQQVIANGLGLLGVSAPERM